MKNFTCINFHLVQPVANLHNSSIIQISVERSDRSRLRIQFVSTIFSTLLSSGYTPYHPGLILLEMWEVYERSTRLLNIILCEKVKKFEKKTVKTNTILSIPGRRCECQNNKTERAAANKIVLARRGNRGETLKRSL